MQQTYVSNISSDLNALNPEQMMHNWGPEHEQLILSFLLDEINSQHRSCISSFPDGNAVRELSKIALITLEWSHYFPQMFMVLGDIYTDAAKLSFRCNEFIATIGFVDKSISNYNLFISLNTQLGEDFNLLQVEKKIEDANYIKLRTELNMEESK